MYFRLNSELQYSVVCLLEGVSLIVAPLTGHIYGYIAVMTLQAGSRGFIDTGKSSHTSFSSRVRKNTSYNLQGKRHCDTCIQSANNINVIIVFLEYSLKCKNTF